MFFLLLSPYRKTRTALTPMPKLFRNNNHSSH
jgi:hypothetical protein